VPRTLWPHKSNARRWTHTLLAKREALRAMERGGEYANFTPPLLSEKFTPLSSGIYKKKEQIGRENALVEQKIEPGKVNRKMVHGKLPILMLRAFPRLLCFPFSTFTVFAANCIRLDTKSINFMLTRFSALIEDVQENIFALGNKYFLR